MPTGSGSRYEGQAADTLAVSEQSAASMFMVEDFNALTVSRTQTNRHVHSDPESHP
jgi:hypothetical protein